LQRKLVLAEVLRIWPLLAAVNAHAISVGAILPTSNPTCSDNGFGCTAGDNALSSLGGITGVALYTTAFYELTSSPLTLTLSASGTLDGTSGIPAGNTIPLSYDFILAPDVGTVTSWSLDFQFLDGSTVIGDSGDITDTGLDLTTQQEFSGTSSLTTTGNAALGDNVTEQVTLTVDTSIGAGVSIGVPGVTSFDLQSTPSINSVPEPGTWGLMAFGIALGGFYRLRRVYTSNNSPRATHPSFRIRLNMPRGLVSDHGRQGLFR